MEKKAGSVSVMDIYTGEIIALHSSPSFDPNLFLYGINSKEWKDINKDPLKPLLNKSISGLYSPGSTIKPIVALSALENDVISPKFKVYCSGKTELYDHTYHCWKEKGHRSVNLREAIKQSCDTYFYEIARLLGVDRLNITAKKFGLGEKVFDNMFMEEKKGIVPSTKWKKNVIGQNWYLGETLINGIGQGYIQTTPLQLCLMTAQLANGGFKIFPKLIVDQNQKSHEEVVNSINAQLNEFKSIKKDTIFEKGAQFFSSFSNTNYPLFRNPENVKFVLDAMYGSTNEVFGTSYSSRYENEKYRYAGKTGTAQVKRITERERELDLDISQIPYEQRDHALFVAFGPYKNPRYALSIFVEHGGSGSKTAAPIAKKLFKVIIDRHEKREKIRTLKLKEI
tara:strand:+ start:3 stop:1190 length:1188 start_codon:yes stop_codon:yes gene_type:complete